MTQTPLDIRDASLPLLRAMLALHSATREPLELQLESLRVAQTHCDEAHRAIEHLCVQVEARDEAGSQ